MLLEPTLFWARMRDLGILEDLLKTIGMAVDQVKGVYLHGNPGTEEIGRSFSLESIQKSLASQRLSGLANALDLGEIFAQKIHSRYVQTTLESSLLSKELHGRVFSEFLNQAPFLDLQRKAEEQKRKLENAKRKSEAFDQIIKNTKQIKPEQEMPVDVKKIRLNL